MFQHHLPPGQREQNYLGPPMVPKKDTSNQDGCGESESLSDVFDGGDGTVSGIVARSSGGVIDEYVRGQPSFLCWVWSLGHFDSGVSPFHTSYSLTLCLKSVLCVTSKWQDIQYPAREPNKHLRVVAEVILRQWVIAKCMTHSSV